MKNKNLHLIPTDKPSRLHLIENALTITSEYKNSVCDSEVNIYITNDEVPKDGEWCIFGESGLTQYCSDYSKKMYRKIILTDNQDLIKDGVQKIDDEFLEWFIKNPSCEEVEIEKICNNCGDINCIHAICSSQISKNKGVTYKIIIPKEPKQDYSGVHLRHCYQGEYEDGCKYGEDDCPAKPLEEPKQETLEEAAENYARKQCDDMYDDIAPSGGNWGWETSTDFIAGAKWQQERSYSEEELISFAHFYFREEFNSAMQTSKATDEIFQLWKEQQLKTVYYE